MRRLPAIALLILLAGAAQGCARFADFARTRADKAAYEIVEEKRAATLDRVYPMNVYRTMDEATSRALESAPRLDMSVDAYTTPSYTLSLADTLAIAVSNNRDYQSQKESLFLQALGLTETRRDFSTIFTGSADASYSRVESGSDTPAGSTVERFGSRGFNLGLSRILAVGARVSLDFTHDYVRYFTNSSGGTASNRLGFNVVQPLLRSAGPLVTQEPLRQNERNMIYAVRNFQRYQQSFVIDAASRFYDLLNARQQLRNVYDNLQQVQDNFDKVSMLNEAGRRSQLEVDQARQELLQAELRWSDTQASYASRLENFKDYLALPLDLDVGPDPAELDRISRRGLVQPGMTLDEALDRAVAERLDLKNTAEQYEDEERAVKIAFQNFLPDLDLSYAYSTARSDDKDRVNLNFRDNAQTWGLDLGLPFDWTPRRNRYREALISLEQARRGLEEERNAVVIEVRDNWRELDRLATSYRIQEESVVLAERRVDNVSLQLEMGQATTRDWLEAQADLLDAQNALTQALVDYTIERLRFWNSIEQLEIDPRGMWYE